MTDVNKGTNGFAINICEKLLELPFISDLHVTVGDSIWYRDSGDLLKIQDDLIIDADDIASMLVKIQPDLAGKLDSAIEKREAMREADDQRTGLDFGSVLGGKRVRVNISKANSGQHSIVLRKLNNVIPKYEETTLPPAVLQQSIRPSGLVLFTGPTGSGKSTSLASILDYINAHYKKHILTIEDPTEYLFDSKLCKITRKEIGIDAPSFPAALRASLRQDPDVIMVGEIRDRETMRIAIAAAETGHLVFATLHTNSATKTIDRVTSFFPGDEKDWAASVFSTTLNCIVSQTLLKRADGQGRVLAYEVLVNEPGVRNLIKEQKIMQIVSSMEQGSSKGHVTMNRHLVELVKSKVVIVDEALAASNDVESLKGLLTSAGLLKQGI